jgi:hypothetical protein
MISFVVVCGLILFLGQYLEGMFTVRVTQRQILIDESLGYML